MTLREVPSEWTVSVNGDGQWQVVPEFEGRPLNPSRADRYGGLVWSQAHQRRRIMREIRREERRYGVSDLPIKWPSA